MFQSIVLTGATGFVGRHLSRLFASRYPQAKLSALVRSVDTGLEPGVEPVVTDMQDSAAMAAALAPLAPDLIVHLAAQASVAQSEKAKGETWDANFGMTRALGQATAAAAPQSVFLFVSTGEVYGASFKAGPANEQTALLPTNPYARAKVAAELVLVDTLHADNRLIIARPFNHTGPGQDARFVLPSFAAQIAAIEAGRAAPKIMVGNLDAIRDFSDVRDVCNAYALLADQALMNGLRGTFNIASGEPRVLGDILQLLLAQSRTAIVVETDPARLRPNDIPVVASSSALLHNTTGWQRAFSFEQTLSDLLAAARSRA